MSHLPWIAMLAACGGSAAKAPARGSSSPPAEPPPTAEVTQGTPPPEPIDPAAANVASIEFLDVLRAAKPAIGRCLDEAASKDSTIKDVELSIAATFNADGTLSKLTLDPIVSTDFDACVKALAKSWKMTLTQQMSFKASMKLSP